MTIEQAMQFTKIEEIFGSKIRDMFELEINYLTNEEFYQLLDDYDYMNLEDEYFSGVYESEFYNIAKIYESLDESMIKAMFETGLHKFYMSTDGRGLVICGKLR